MDNELREQIKVHVADAMSEGEVNSNLDWHISIFMRVIQQEIAKARTTQGGRAMTDKETAIAALENLASNLDTTATIMRRLGNPYRNKSPELSGAWEMVQEWIAAIRLEAEL